MFAFAHLSHRQKSDTFHNGILSREMGDLQIRKENCNLPLLMLALFRLCIKCLEPPRRVALSSPKAIKLKIDPPLSFRHASDVSSASIPVSPVRLSAGCANRLDRDLGGGEKKRLKWSVTPDHSKLQPFDSPQAFLAIPNRKTNHNKGSRWRFHPPLLLVESETLSRNIIFVSNATNRDSGPQEKSQSRSMV